MIYWKDIQGSAVLFSCINQAWSDISSIFCIIPFRGQPPNHQKTPPFWPVPNCLRLKYPKIFGTCSHRLSCPTKTVLSYAILPSWHTVSKLIENAPSRTLLIKKLQIGANETGRLLQVSLFFYSFHLSVGDARLCDAAASELDSARYRFTISRVECLKSFLSEKWSLPPLRNSIANVFKAPMNLSGPAVFDFLTCVWRDVGTQSGNSYPPRKH